ncbi:peroxiredoxin-like family protein [uncultured Microbulbifer sp.]|uniref:peroxiredoxin-like family protein n=1 Tax=uncultured Microbulbifer sp. TaxID=348147 RepID=UPI0026044F0F|nr:peroxiredoxin-like family protein [uncultured Microbulbifer sp.]
MKSLKQQTDAKIAAGRQANPDFMKGVDSIIEQAKSLQQGSDAIKVGQEAPDFELPDSEGKPTSLGSLLENGPLVLVFYRGSWCPYCNLQLNALQEYLQDIRSLGASLVAISPQVPDGTMTPDEISKMDFAVLSDQDAKTASQYGLAWEVPEFLIEHMRVDRNLDLETINNGNGSVLAIPATFVLDRNGVVTWRHVDVDYRTRSEPADIVEALQKLS